MDGTVERNETYIGGKQNTYRDSNKQIVVGIRKRGVDLRFFHANHVKSGMVANFIRKTSAQT